MGTGLWDMGVNEEGRSCWHEREDLHVGGDSQVGIKYRDIVEGGREGERGRVGERE